MPAEKEFLAENIQFTYEGVFDIIEFFKAVEAWAKKEGREIDMKKRLEHVEPEGKKIEYAVELWRDEDRIYRTIVRLRALFDDVTEVQIKKGKAKRKLNKGRVLIKIDTMLETNWEGNWHQKTTYNFLRTLFDRFIWNIHEHKYVHEAVHETHDFEKTLKAFFQMYKY